MYAFRRQLQQWWADGWDVLLTPTVAEAPPPLSEFAPDPDDAIAQSRRAWRFVPFTPPFNMSGQPAISLPLHWNDGGLPIGVQLVAAYGREDVLIRVAAQLSPPTHGRTGTPTSPEPSIWAGSLTTGGTNPAQKPDWHDSRPDRGGRAIFSLQFDEFLPKTGSAASFRDI